MQATSQRLNFENETQNSLCILLPLLGKSASYRLCFNALRPVWHRVYRLSALICTHKEDTEIKWQKELEI